MREQAEASQNQPKQPGTRLSWAQAGLRALIVLGLGIGGLVMAPDWILSAPSDLPRSTRIPLALVEVATAYLALVLVLRPLHPPHAPGEGER